ncbi:S41 family peptidase [Urbifossiella limnaea]|uniref:Carboxy-terminal processing protease CtpB n=1 Tax=Urbifossiella limnaea TaxID=2528023 RepID=A0A517XY05_9BACT|nr:S41 family peptidase [Urbifossiella limnaea]QDU22387.1 Carboxy-terminal processing protease CtpB precursor [Urbifossiella limnaea]
MTAPATLRRFAAAAVLLAALGSAAPAAPLSGSSPAQLRARAAAAERAGDWDAALAALLDLPAADRAEPATRDRLVNAARRATQARRHRDPAFQQFVAALPVRDAGQVFGDAVGKLAGAFADPGRATPQRLWAAGVEELDRALGSRAFVALFLTDTAALKIESFRLALRADWAARPVGDPREARALLKGLIGAAQDELAPRVPAALAAEVLCGACAGLDEYTAFLTPEPAAEQPADLGGHGLFLGFDSDGPFVDGIAPGSWVAFHTQLHRGDRVARVNGRSMILTPMELADALRNPDGGLHTLELMVPGTGMLSEARLPVVPPTVFGGRMVGGRDGVGYLRVAEFQPATPRELAEAIAGLKEQGLRALVLDVRGNPGGSFLAGVEAARRFLPAGAAIVTTHGQLPQVAGHTFSSASGPAALDLPLVLLVDGDTASAAEVLAAALRDNQRAVLVGTSTFGKGTLQFPLKLSGPGSVRVTIARLVAPSGPLSAGVAPHLIETDPHRQLELAADRAAELSAPRPMLVP